MKNRARLLLLLVLPVVLVLAASPGRPLKVGVVAGPQAEIMEVVKTAAARDGLRLEIVVYDDYIKPNIALNRGEIDVNCVQHGPYLSTMAEDRSYNLVAAARTVYSPLALYSLRYASAADIPAGAVIALPRDPFNEGRALILLAKLGLVKLKTDEDLSPTVEDIVDNPKRLIFREMDAGETPQALPEAAVAAINANFSLTAGLSPAKALISESAASPYAGVIAVRTRDRDNPAIAKLVAAYHSPEVAEFIRDRFNGTIQPAW